MYSLLRPLPLVVSPLRLGKFKVHRMKIWVRFLSLFTSGLAKINANLCYVASNIRIIVNQYIFDDCLHISPMTASRMTSSLKNEAEKSNLAWKHRAKFWFTLSKSVQHLQRWGHRMKLFSYWSFSGQYLRNGIQHSRNRECVHLQFSAVVRT